MGKELQRARRAPSFDLVVLEAVEAWRLAIRDKRRADAAAKAALTSTQKHETTIAQTRAMKRLIEARTNCELALRSSVEAEEP